jgi:hypothetical protein
MLRFLLDETVDETDETVASLARLRRDEDETLHLWRLARAQC